MQRLFDEQIKDLAAPGLQGPRLPLCRAPKEKGSRAFSQTTRHARVPDDSRHAEPPKRKIKSVLADNPPRPDSGSIEASGSGLAGCRLTPTRHPAWPIGVAPSAGKMPEFPRVRHADRPCPAAVGFRGQQELSGSAAGKGPKGPQRM